MQNGVRLRAAGTPGRAAGTATCRPRLSPHWRRVACVQETLLCVKETQHFMVISVRVVFACHEDHASG
eukprot:8343863-Lingulodinium_polyedra.AAC.1